MPPIFYGPRNKRPYHIRKALERAAKEDVYNYMVEKMKTPRNLKQEEQNLNIYESATEELKEQGRSYAVAKAAMEEFCTDNEMDLNSMVDQFSQKHKKLTREELIEANKAVAARQAGKFAKPSEMAPVPTPEGLDKIAKESVKYNGDIASQQLEIRTDRNEF